MRSLLRASIGLVSVAMLSQACSNEVAITGGTGGGSTDASSSSGGSTGTGGTVVASSGGSTGSGGNVVAGTGGSSTGSGGSSTSSGGSTGSGGAATGGRGGGGGGGAVGGAGGGGRGGGGATGSGGASSGGRGGGGAPGSGGASGTVTVDTFAGIPNANNSTLKNAFIMFGCYSLQNQDCLTIPSGTACDMAPPNFEDKGLKQTESFTVGGTMGVTYNMTFTVRGIAEAKYYMNGTRDAGNTDPANPDDPAGIDTFYRGGAPINQEFYNVYKMIVRDAAGAEVTHYYLNSFPKANVSYENHRTFPIHFSKTIPVPGGGRIDLFSSDANCRAVNNCGAGATSTTCPATSGRMVPVGAGEPALMIPTMYLGKSVASINLQTGTSQPFKAQILNIFVTAVAPM